MKKFKICGEYWYILGTDGKWYFSKGAPNDWKKVSENLGVGA